MRQSTKTLAIVIMGVSGSGKSTVGRLLAARLGAEFTDADDLHSDDNISLMAAGRALSDADRLPWLRTVGEHLASPRVHNVVVACSALKRSYRDVLRDYAPDTSFVFLDGPLKVVKERIEHRNHEFMPATLLDSQFESLEPLASDEHGVRIGIELEPTEIVERVLAELSLGDTKNERRNSIRR